MSASDQVRGPERSGSADFVSRLDGLRPTYLVSPGAFISNNFGLDVAILLLFVFVSETLASRLSPLAVGSVGMIAIMSQGVL